MCHQKKLILIKKSTSQILDDTNTLLAAVSQRVKSNQNCHDGMKTFQRACRFVLMVTSAWCRYRL